MAFIKIDNNDLQVLIDDEYENFEFAQKSQVTLVGGPPGAELYGTVTYQGHANSTPLVAVVLNGSEAPVIPMSITRSGNTFTIKVNSWRAWGGSRIATLLIYDRPVSNAGTGLVVVRNAQGRVTFDSDKKYMKVIQAFTLSGGSSIVLPGGKTIALLYASPWLYFSRFFVRWPDGSVAYGAQHDSLFTSLSGLTLTFSRQIYFYAVGGAASVPPGWGDFATLSPGNYLLLDATGL